MMMSDVSCCIDFERMNRDWIRIPLLDLPPVGSSTLGALDESFSRLLIEFLFCVNLLFALKNSEENDDMHNV
jgi:hypothetical protein